MRKPVFLSANEAAELAGVAIDTWRSYVHRHQAPEPHQDPSTGLPSRDPATGKIRWLKDDVVHWLRNRPGAGARTAGWRLRYEAEDDPEPVRPVRKSSRSAAKKNLAAKAPAKKTASSAAVSKNAPQKPAPPTPPRKRT